MDYEKKYKELLKKNRELAQQNEKLAYQNRNLEDDIARILKDDRVMLRDAILDLLRG